MTKLTSIRAEFVEYIPAKGEPGVIYVSQRFRTAMHLCCCGCGLEVVTPLNPAKWAMTRDGDRVSLKPSIGNWSFPCRSHYWIDRGTVRWAGPMTEIEVRRVRRLDAVAASRQFEPPAPRPHPSVLPPAAPTPLPQRRPTSESGWMAAVKKWLRRLLG